MIITTTRKMYDNYNNNNKTQGMEKKDWKEITLKVNGAYIWKVK